MSSPEPRASVSGVARIRCKYEAACSRTHPMHFEQMSHPEFEEIVLGQLGEDRVTLPERLKFECPNRETLTRQLTAVRQAMRKIHGITGKAQGQETRREAVGAEKPTTSPRANVTSDVLITNEMARMIETKRQQALEKLAANNKMKLANVAPSAAQNSSKRSSTALFEDSSGSKQSKMFGSSELKANPKKSFEQEEEDDVILVYNSNESTPTNEQKKNKDDENVAGCSGISTEKRGDVDKDPGYYSKIHTADGRKELREKIRKQMKSTDLRVMLAEPDKFDAKHKRSAPFYNFYARVADEKATYDQEFTVTFPEILDRSLGVIESSLQINFLVDVGWLLLQYIFACQRSNMLLIYGQREDSAPVPPQIKLWHLEMAPFFTHHSKVMVLRYKNDDLRVVVSTANLYADDWLNRTQGVWISPLLPRLPESKGSNETEGESRTSFKHDFLLYLGAYDDPRMLEWIELVRNADFSSVNVFFVASVPGRHINEHRPRWGLKKLGTILSEHLTLSENQLKWAIVAQCSSIGSLGDRFARWVGPEFAHTMALARKRINLPRPNFMLIYPTYDNYLNSFDKDEATLCLANSQKTHNKQRWLADHAYQWKAENTKRDRACPHIKTYTRISPDHSKIAWFLLTSANLSKAAWGADTTAFSMRNYEAGVLFLPRFVTGFTTFSVNGFTNEGPPFVLPYDLPLTPYTKRDSMFVKEFLERGD